jgi:hypothetical protein
MSLRVGKISSVRIQTDKVTGKGKGFAFMEFPEVEAMQVMSMGYVGQVRCSTWKDATKIGGFPNSMIFVIEIIESIVLP